MAGGRPEGAREQHADCAFRACAAVDGLSQVGLGNGGQRASIGVSQAIWFGNGPQWAHSSGPAKGGRQHHVSYGDVHGVSTAAARDGAETGANESSGGKAAECAGFDHCELRRREEYTGAGGFAAGLNRSNKVSCKLIEFNGVVRNWGVYICLLAAIGFAPVWQPGRWKPAVSARQFRLTPVRPLREREVQRGGIPAVG